MEKVLNLPEIQPIHTIIEHENSVDSVAVNRGANNAQFATGSHDRTLKIWDSEKLNCVTTMKGHDGGVWCVTYNPQGNLIATASPDSTGRLWDFKAGK